MRESSPRGCSSASAGSGRLVGGRRSFVIHSKWAWANTRQILWHIIYWVFLLREHYYIIVILLCDFLDESPNSRPTMLIPYKNCKVYLHPREPHAGQLPHLACKPSFSTTWGGILGRSTLSRSLTFSSHL